MLSPLEPFRDKLVVVTGLYSDQAEALGDGGGDHSRASGTYLTGVHVKRSDTVVENGISMDQIAAKAFERETQLSSLQLTVDDASLVGACDVGYSCAYSSTLSWLTPTLPLMAENNPRVVFERLFGSSDSTDARVRASRLQQDRSILDSITDRVKALQRKLGPGDNRKVNDYLESLRDVERRIQKAEEQSGQTASVARDRANARRHSRWIRAACSAALRSAAAGLPVRPDSSDDSHVRPRTEWTALPADRRSRTASSADPSPERSREDGQVRQDPDVSRQAIRRLS